MENFRSPDGMSGMFVLWCKHHAYFDMEVALFPKGDVPPTGFRRAS